MEGTYQPGLVINIGCAPAPKDRFGRPYEPAAQQDD